MTRKKRILTRAMTFSALYLGLALALPFLTGQIPEIGSMLCPMHIPAMLCGYMCGMPWGIAVGAVAPLMRGVLFGMPAIYPTGIAMAFELAAYGAISGIMYRIFPHVKGRLYAILIISMVAGRIVWGIAEFVLLSISGTAFSLELFAAGAVVNALPGIILQIVIIPPLVKLAESAGLILNS